MGQFTSLAKNGTLWYSCADLSIKFEAINWPLRSFACQLIVLPVARIVPLNVDAELPIVKVGMLVKFQRMLAALPIPRVWALKEKADPLPATLMINCEPVAPLKLIARLFPEKKLDNALEFRLRFSTPLDRSEERRVGKECRSRW